MQSKPDESKRNLIALFLQHVDSNVNPQFLRDVVMGFLIAGRDTTAQTLSWCLYCINDRPEIYQRLQDELQDQLQRMTAPTIDQVQSLVFMEAVLKETLRLYPPVPFNWKTAIEDTTLSDGTRIPKGTSVAFPSYALGRMTTVWGPGALMFKPGRWLNEKTGKLRQVSPFQFPAFHAGPRICLGRNLALLEMKLVLVGLLSHGLKIDLEPGQPVTYGSGITLPLKPGLLGRVRASI
ncbi:hypothetical protein Poli38472_005245 [Pythium oligandrum]|uniref:Cytochrome P450 n=1 Tax=Pythium oligandrum TaxID=41045 RepID=A0A8K1FKA6_PYTOL|nr:hypothetical protein Poli38472_005245 [Pythium oligandrum]|eukprot:TMW62627.1 hypothetical protein Poli38472_005245 [Pythium oligandrum]